MNEKFAKRLQEYLESECSDYDLKFSLQWNEDCGCCDVTILRDDHNQNTKEVRFKYDKEKDDLLIELSEDAYYITREFDQTVKYFWMLICPALFPNK
jgi:hypothetical protein